jgi:Surface lipoprotein
MNNHPSHRVFAIISCVIFLIALSGCATTRKNDKPNVDPLEPINRPIYTFNDTLDRYLLRPVAEAYAEHIPAGMRRGIGNFFDNVVYPNTMLNDLLQGKFKQFAADSARFVVNSTMGVLGLFDIAITMGLQAHEEDFGQTLGRWGLGPGLYLQIPFFGPSTVRDAPGIGVGIYTNVLFYLLGGVSEAGLPLNALDFVDARARLKSAIAIRDEAALDPYVFTREAYLQRRNFLIYDGYPPTPDIFEEFDDFDE